MAKEAITIEAAGREVRLSSPSKVFFPGPGFTKRDLAEYYVAVADAACLHLRERPTTMKRFVDGAEGEFFFQKRVPNTAPDWIETATVKFPSGRSATELCANDSAHLVWAVNLGVIDFNPWPARRADLDHPDELRVDLDPTPESNFDEVRQVALCVREVLEDHGLRGYPEDLGVSRDPRQRPDRAEVGLHRGPPRRPCARARGRAALEACDLQVVEGGAPRRLRRLQPERPRPHRRQRLVGAPGCRRARLDATRMGRGRRRRSCRAATRHGAGEAEGARRSVGYDRRRRPFARLSARARRPRRGRGLGDAPWPPHFRKQKGEPKRVQPSKAKKKT